MELDWTIQGVEELFQNLDLYERKANDAMNLALREGGEVMKANYVASTPVNTGQARGDVHVGRVSSDGDSGHKSINVGYGDDSYYYMWFVHDGTYSKGNPKGIVPRKHIEPNINSWFIKAQAVMADSMRNSLG